MRIKEHKIKRAVCQIDFDKALAYYSEEGNIALELRQRFTMDQYQRTADQFNLRNTREKQWVFVEPIRIRSMCNDVDDFRTFKKFVNDVYSSTRKMRPAKRSVKGEPAQSTRQDLARMGLRLMYLAEAEAETLDDLNEVILNRLLNGGFMKSIEFCDAGISDTGVMLDFEKGNAKGHIEIGPLAAKEAAKRYNEDEEDCPSFSFLVDCDYGLKRIEPDFLPSLGNFLADGHKQIQRAADLVFNLLGEVQDV